MKKASLCVIMLLVLSLLCACGKQAPAASVPEIAAPEDRPEVFSDFSSTDIYGNPVDQTVFADHTLTMVNIWATTCNPCVKEMPELFEISQEYADKGVAIVGIPADITNRSGQVKDAEFEAALELVDLTGADYLHIIPCSEIIEAKLINVQAFPHTVFLDDQGRQVGEVYSGSKEKAEWTAIIDGLLGAMG